VTFAHAGHWLVDILYAAPLLLVVGFIVRDRIKERRRRAAAEVASSDLASRN
jgi:hypothetical protein